MYDFNVIVKMFTHGKFFKLCSYCMKNVLVYGINLRKNSKTTASVVLRMVLYMFCNLIMIPKLLRLTLTKSNPWQNNTTTKSVFGFCQWKSMKELMANKEMSSTRNAFIRSFWTTWLPMTRNTVVMMK